jgi:hypothetical protein
MNKILLILAVVVLSGCDVVDRIKYEYYYNYKGEILCRVNTSANNFLTLDENLKVENLKSNYPQVIIKDKVHKFNKMVDNEKIVNLQRLEQDSGISHVIIIHKARGELLYSIIGNDNENLVSNSYRANCK